VIGHGRKQVESVINVSDTFAAAMVYVMLSRVCALEQIFILNKFDEAKMYPNRRALEELKRLDKISMNNNPSQWEKEDNKALKISSLNCRSLKKHHQDIISDAVLLKSDMICLQEIWLESDENIQPLMIPNYDLYLNSNGRGKGVAAYCRKDIFRHQIDIKRENMQLSKYAASDLDIIVLYRSQQGNHKELIQIIEEIQTEHKPLLILGDFNFCFLENSSNQTRRYLEKHKFVQMISEPTHIEGNLLDQAYLRDLNGKLDCTAEVHSKYYTDHKGLAIIINRKR
jgi:exonuclease III